MARDGDGLFPVGYIRLDHAGQDRGAEDRAVEDRADRPIRAFPHLVELVFFDALLVRRDRGAFDADVVLFDGVACVDCDPIARGVPVREAEVIVFGVQLHKRRKQLVLDLLPQDAGHLIAVHFDDGICHFDLVHYTFSLVWFAA